MSRYRKYKNGIYGARYKKYYIVPDGEPKKKKVFSIQDADLAVVRTDIDSFADCVWTIDLLAADKNEMETIRKLYTLDLPDLSEMMMQLRNKEGGLTKKEEYLLELVEKVRERKAAGKGME